MEPGVPSAPQHQHGSGPRHETQQGSQTWGAAADGWAAGSRGGGASALVLQRDVSIVDVSDLGNCSVNWSVLPKAGRANHVEGAGQVVEADATVDGHGAGPELQV
jgi:hypothetical protein